MITVRFDSLTHLAIKFKKTNCCKAIKSIQNLITPIAKKLLMKWKFHRFPSLIYDKVYNDSKSIILVKTIKKYNIPTDCKFSSFYGTSLNFHLRSQYMGYFQNGKPISKRYMDFNTYSLDIEYSDKEDSSMKSYIVDNRFTPLSIRINSGLSILNEDERKILENIYYNNLSINRLTKELDMKANDIKLLKQKGLEKMKVIFNNNVTKEVAR